MPLYPFRCPDCGHQKEVFMYADAYTDVQVCICGAKLHRVFTPLPFHMYQERYNHGLGGHVASKRDEKDLIKQREQEHFDNYGFEIGIEPKY